MWDEREREERTVSRLLTFFFPFFGYEDLSRGGLLECLKQAGLTENHS